MMLEKIEEVIEKTNINIGRMKFRNKPEHPISVACANGWLHIVKYFYNSADDTQVGKYNEMYFNLTLSITNEHHEITDYLLNKNIKLLGYLGGMSCLDTAILLKNYKLAKTLILQGFPIEFDEHHTLKKVIEADHRESIKFVLKCYDPKVLNNLKIMVPEVKKYIQLARMKMMVDGFFQINQEMIKNRNKMLN